MNEKKKNILTYIIGLLGGILSGFFGSGGGLIVLPGMVNFLDVDEYEARGTTLSVILITTIASSFFYYKNNFFDFKIGIYTIIGGIVGGIIGAKLTHKFSKFYLAMMFYIFMIFMGIRMIL